MSAQSAGLKIGITTDDIWNPIAPLDLAWAEHNLCVGAYSHVGIKGNIAADAAAKLGQLFPVGDCHF